MQSDGRVFLEMGVWRPLIQVRLRFLLGLSIGEAWNRQGFGKSFRCSLYWWFHCSYTSFFLLFILAKWQRLVSMSQEAKAPRACCLTCFGRACGSYLIFISSLSQFFVQFFFCSLRKSIGSRPWRFWYRVAGLVGINWITWNWFSAWSGLKVLFRIYFLNGCNWQDPIYNVAYSMHSVDNGTKRDHVYHDLRNRICLEGHFLGSANRCNLDHRCANSKPVDDLFHCIEIRLQIHGVIMNSFLSSARMTRTFAES